MLLDIKKTDGIYLSKLLHSCVLCMRLNFCWELSTCFDGRRWIYKECVAFATDSAVLMLCVWKSRDVRVARSRLPDSFLNVWRTDNFNAEINGLLQVWHGLLIFVNVYNNFPDFWSLSSGLLLIFRRKRLLTSWREFPKIYGWRRSLMTATFGSWSL